MNDEQFDREMLRLEDIGFSAGADQLRARDTAQREALARVEAELHDALAKAPTQWAYDQACRTLHKHREIANTAQAQLAEAVDLLADAVATRELEREAMALHDKLNAFLARHAQAEQQEACEYCGHGKHTGLPGGACENCMNTGLKHPQQEAQGAQAGQWKYCPECGSDEISHSEGEHNQCANCKQEWFSDIDYSDVVQAHLSGHYSDKDVVIANLRAALATQPAEHWIACSDRLPEVAEGCQQEFIVCARRNQSGKLAVMSALYLNAYPLYCDHDDEAADEDGNIPHTGWYDAKSNGDDANCYSEIDDSRYAYGAKVTHWMPLPQPVSVRGTEQ